MRDLVTLHLVISVKLHTRGLGLKFEFLIAALPAMLGGAGMDNMGVWEEGSRLAVVLFPMLLSLLVLFAMLLQLLCLS